VSRPLSDHEAALTCALLIVVPLLVMAGFMAFTAALIKWVIS
jgi:hypothetical protein